MQSPLPEIPAASERGLGLMFQGLACTGFALGIIGVILRALDINIL